MGKKGGGDKNDGPGGNAGNDGGGFGSGGHPGETGDTGRSFGGERGGNDNTKGGGRGESGGEGGGHPGQTNNPAPGFTAIESLKNHSSTGLMGLTGGAKRTAEIQSANAYYDFDHPMSSTNPVDRTLAAAGGWMGLTADPRKSDPNAIAGILAGGAPFVGLAMKGYQAVDGLSRGDFRPAGSLAGGMLAGGFGSMLGGAAGGMIGTGTPAGRMATPGGAASNAVGAITGSYSGYQATGGDSAPEPAAPTAPAPATPEPAATAPVDAPAPTGLLTQADVTNRSGGMTPEERFSAALLTRGTF